MLALRDFQQRCHDAVLAEWGYEPYWDGARDTARSTIAQLATSAGKTLIAAHLAKTLTERYNARVLFVADRLELIAQPVEKFHQACGIIASVHQGDNRASSHAPVVIGSIQTLTRSLPPGPPVTHIMDDEAHRSSDARKKIHEAYPDAKIVGFTATAFRKNLADLSDYYDTVAFELGTFDLIDQGYITPIKVLTLPLDVDLTGVHQRNGDFNQDEVETAIAPVFRAVADKIKEHAADRTILAFLPLIRSSQAFVQILQQEGISARHVDGSSPDRREILESFERGDFQVLSNSQVMSTGVDFIRCNCLLNLSPTRSRVEYRQRAGRIMRLLPGVINPGGVTLPTAEERKAAIAASAKPECLILDLLWQTAKIGLAGPASLIAMNEDDERDIGDRVRKQRTPEELEQLSREVQADREERLRKELEAAARQRQLEEHRAASLMDARELMLQLHDRDMLSYEPVSRWERNPITDKQRTILEQLGLNPDTVSCMGLASRLLDAVFGRQRRGLAPYEAFPLLRERGIEKPQETTLDDSIRILRGNWPMTFGKVHRGKPIDRVPHSFWAWFTHVAPQAVRDQVRDQHPGVWRYWLKFIATKPKQQPELMTQ